MQYFIEWKNNNGKPICLQYQGDLNNIERTAFEISKVWKSRIVRIKTRTKEAKEEKTIFAILRR